MVSVRAAMSDAGLAVVLATAALWLVKTIAGRLPPGTLPVAAVYLHVWLTILDGGWTGLRRATWLVLGLSWLGAIVTVFLGWILPAGQIGFWLAGKGWLPPTGDASVRLAIGLVAALPFTADLAVATMLRLRERSTRHAATLLVAVAVLVALFGVAGAQEPVPTRFDGAWTPAEIVPPWYMLPWYAILRAPTDKLLGVGLMTLAILLPLAAPWTRAERFRSGAAGLVWPLFCLLLLADFVALGWLGAQPADDGVVAASRLLTAVWFAFFLLAPPLTAGLARRSALSPGG